jgi:TolA-binding protein
MKPEPIFSRVRELIGDAPPGDARAAALRQRVLEQRVAHRSRAQLSLRVAWTAAGAAALLAVWGAWTFRGTAPADSAMSTRALPSQQFSSGAWLRAPAEAPLELPPMFGGRARLSAGAVARVHELSRARAHLVLESGVASFVIDAAAGVPWSVDAGPYQVRVVGTAFELDWSPLRAALEVRVSRGRVRVTGPNLERDGILVEAGQRVVLDASGSAEARIPLSPSTDAAEKPHSAAPDTHGDPRATARDWRELARQGRHADALELVNASGFEASLSTLPLADLVLLADAARLAPSPLRARLALLALRDRFGSSEAARRAAFHLGRIAADVSGSTVEAERWFATYLRESPRGAFAQEALGRLIVAQQKLGRREDAREHARRYLERYPDGAHAKVARSLL